MRLDKIKLAGFKSFVDPTTVKIPGNLMAIVGPNGCGKSNIIDAVRWVMGESSAKHLRGGHMTDVIFNGSSTRQPVNQASVELIFDNSEGRLGGEYAKYSTISIKRLVNREGISTYILNNTKCRRRDVTDLFLGTGLGARSYAIIEQGTISRMVEAKPDEMREHIEEAAGISKYKERRHETEIRMRHTRENLDRLNDLRDEVEKQLKHLKSQAKKAEKYTDLKQQERQHKRELLAMSWQRYEQSFSGQEQQLQTIAERHNAAALRQVELKGTQESKIERQKEQQQQLQQLQENLYKVASEVNRLEQTIAHTEQDHVQLQQELQRLRSQKEGSVNDIGHDKQQLEEISQALVETEAAIETARDRETEMLEMQQSGYDRQQDWQEQWQNFGNKYSTVKGQVEIQQAQIVQLETQQEQLQIRLESLQDERHELSDSAIQIEIETLDQTIELIEAKRAEFHQQLEKLHDEIDQYRQQVKQIQETLHENRSELHGINGKITSLELLQQHSMGKNNKKLNDWLQAMDLDNKKRLAESIEVDSAWELAVEKVLATSLDAICIDNFDQFIGQLDSLEDQSLTLLETSTTGSEPEQQGQLIPLINKIKAPWDISGLLMGVFCADSLETAHRHVRQLQKHQSIITAQGVWLGSGWLKISFASDEHIGVLQREKELRQLKLKQQETQLQLSELEDGLVDAEATLKESENQRESLHQQDKVVAAELTAKSAEFSAHSARLEQQSRRLEQVFIDIEQMNEQLATVDEKAEQALALKEEAVQSLMTLDDEKQTLEELKYQIQAQNQETTSSTNDARQKVMQMQAKIESLKSSQAMTLKQLERLQVLQQQSGSRITELEQKYEHSVVPLAEHKTELNQIQQTHGHREQQLKEARAQLQQTEQEISHDNEDLSRLQKAMDDDKDELNKIRLEQQESKVRQKTVEEQLAEMDLKVEQILTELPEQAEENSWKRKLDDLTVQISRLGPINLSAIEEYQSQSERMDFLSEQHADLTEALNKLDQAIGKIDRETRQRFKETFDKINVGLQTKFPKLFGGGNAYLSLTDDDLLESGVNIIARPPGKKTSSIHLLSGGEKALTAVALVFSIFELNPAPFCMLDEVDAPLDDTNVGRFSKLVEEMSETVQFVYISHNKVTLEIAKQLTGVTMKEPGVSRLVNVDIDEAVSMAEN